MTPEFAFRFAREWIDGANQKDFERVLALYSDDVEASSPYIRLVANLRDGWSEKPSSKTIGRRR